MTDIEYRQLMESSQQKAQRALFDEYFAYVFAIVAGRLKGCGSREDMDECTADVFSEVFLYLDKNSSQNGELKGVVGTIAGDDTIFILVRSESDAKKLSKKFRNELLSGR